MIGVATKTDEYVPISIPINNAKEKPPREGPPNKNRTNTTIKVVIDVIIVLLRVLLIDSFTNGIRFPPTFNPIVSLIISNTTTVSFIE